MTAETKKKGPVHPRHLSLDERLDLLVKRGEAAARQSEADRDRLAGLEAGVAEFKAGAAEFRVGAEALLDAVNKDREAVDRYRKENKGHQANQAKALEDEFIASLPRVMKEAHGIVIKPEDIIARKKLRSAKGGVGAKGEIDFIAPNGELVLAGEAKTHLTLDKVESFAMKLVGEQDCDFRQMFPEYADLPVHGVVAGALIDPDAALRARKRGFVILRLDGAEVHPATVRGARDCALKKY